MRGDRDEALDGLRAIAALLVVFHHCGVNVYLPGVTSLPGYLGVHLFFVLSGFLISRPFLARLIENRPLPSWRRYTTRRFVRIYPTYLVALVVFIGMRAAGHLHAPTFRDVVLHALLVFNWGAPEQFFAINVVMWTLAIEVQFYVILPAAAGLAKKFAPDRGRLLALLVVASFVAIGWISRGLEYSGTSPGDVRFRLPFSFLDLFAVGMLVAYLELTQAAFLRERPPVRCAMLIASAALLIGANYWLTSAGGGDWLTPPTLALVCFYGTLVCTGFGLILLATLTRARYRVPGLTSAALVFVGQISYSMYLFHVGVGYFLLTRLPRDLGSWLSQRPPLYALAQLGPVLAVSYVVYLLVERPSLRWVESFSLRAREREPVNPS